MKQNKTISLFGPFSVRFSVCFSVRFSVLFSVRLSFRFSVRSSVRFSVRFSAGPLFDPRLGPLCPLFGPFLGRACTLKPPVLGLRLRMFGNSGHPVWGLQSQATDSDWIA